MTLWDLIAPGAQSTISNLHRVDNLSEARGLGAQTVQDVLGVKWLEDVNKWLENKAPNTFGNSNLNS